MPGWGDYNSGTVGYLPPAHDEGERRTIGKCAPPSRVDWGRAYGGDSRTLAQEAAALLAEGYAPEEAARELVLRYGRQVSATGEELREAVEELREAVEEGAT